jgi:hypothetical protein
VRALPPWETAELPRPGGGVLRVTAVPAQHGPDGSEPLVGEVTGFVLSGDGLPLHFEHWAHFTEGAEPLAAAFEQAGLADRLHLPKPGEIVEIPI